MDKYKDGESQQQDNIRSLFKAAARPLKGWEITEMYHAVFGRRYSESGTTARLRQMPDVWCNLSTYEYSLEV